MRKASIFLAGLLSLAVCLGTSAAAEKPAPTLPKPGPVEVAPADKKAETEGERSARLAKTHEQAEDLYAKAQYLDAYRLFAQIALEIPDYRDVDERLRDIRAKLCEQADALHAKGKFRDAERLYAQIALDRPHYPGVARRLRDIRERLEEADRHARRARLERHLEAAKAHFSVANYATAVRACEDALLLDPKNEQAQRLLANAAGELELQRRVTAAIADTRPAKGHRQLIAQATTAVSPGGPPPAEPKAPAPPGKPAPVVRSAGGATLAPPPPPPARRVVGPGANIEIVEAGGPPAASAPGSNAEADPEGSRLVAKAWDTYQAAKLADNPRPLLRQALDTLAPIQAASAHSRHAKGTAALLRKSISRHLAAEGEIATPEEKQRARLYARYVEAEEALRKKNYDVAATICEDILIEDPRFTLARNLRQEAKIKQQEFELLEKQLEGRVRHDGFLIEVEDQATPPKEVPAIERPPIDLTRQSVQIASAELDEKLNQRVSVNLIDADLDYFLDLLFRSTGVNIIYNPEVVADKTITVHVANYPLDQLLDYIARNHGLMFAKTRDGVLITTPEEPRLETFVIPLHQGLVDVLEAPPSAGVAEEGGDQPPIDPPTTSSVELLVEQFPSLIEWPDGSFTYLDRKMNILYLRTTREVHEEVIRMLDPVDQVPPQVHVKALFLEIDATDFESIGTEFSLDKRLNIGHTDFGRRIGWEVSPGDVLKFATDANAEIGDPTGGMNFTLSGIIKDETQFTMTLDALQRSGKTRRLAAPSVICMNNCTARVSVTKDLVYIEDWEVDRADISGTSYGYGNYPYNQPVIDPNDPNYNQYNNYNQLSSEPIIIPRFAEGEDTGFTLDVTVSVGKDTRCITLTLNPRIRKLVETKTYEIIFPITNPTTDEEGNLVPAEPLKGTVEQPIVATRNVATKLVVADGATVVLGGLIQKDKEEIISKIPILSDIPILGQFIGRKTYKDRTTNLVIFVKAELITPSGARYADAGTLNTHEPPRGTPRVEIQDTTAPVVRRAP